MVLPVHNPIIYPPELANHENGKLPDGLLWSTPGQARGPVIRLTESATRSWRAMTAAAGTAGHILKATSSADSYRSYTQQVATFTARYEPDPMPGFIGQRYWPGHYDQLGRWVTAHLWYQKPNTAVAAVPGTSNHGWGLAVDIGEERDGDAGTESIDSASLNWLVVNAHLYGWSAEVQSEPWHWRRYSGDVLEPVVIAFEEDQVSAADVWNYVHRSKDFPNPNGYSCGDILHGTNAAAFEALNLLKALMADIEAAPPGGLTEQQVEDAAFRGAQRAEDA